MGKIQDFDSASDIQIQQYTRRFIMRILGGRLFPDVSKNKVRLFFLDCLEDLNACGQLSWGSTVLAWLYRSLCRATHSKSRTVGGCLTLLQLWAWERIPMCRPQNFWPLGSYPGPYSARWLKPHSYPNTSRHTLRVFRDQLDRLQDGQFEWIPYPPAHLMPAFCSNGMQIYTARVPLIFLFAVEWHYPDRVVRKFGGFQDIPNEPAWYDESVHKLDAHTKGVYWSDYHRGHVATWNNRFQNLVFFNLWQLQINCSREYREWFEPRTRMLVGNPAHRYEDGQQPIAPKAFVYDNLHRKVYNRVLGLKQFGYDHPYVDDVLHSIEDTLRHFDRLHILQTTEPEASTSYVPETQEMGRGRTQGHDGAPRPQVCRGGRRRRRTTTEAGPSGDGAPVYSPINARLALSLIDPDVSEEGRSHQSSPFDDDFDFDTDMFTESDMGCVTQPFTPLSAQFQAFQAGSSSQQPHWNPQREQDWATELPTHNATNYGFEYPLNVSREGPLFGDVVDATQQDLHQRAQEEQLGRGGRPRRTRRKPGCGT